MNMTARIMALSAVLACIATSAVAQTPFGESAREPQVVRDGKYYEQSGLAFCENLDTCDLKFRRLRDSETVLFKTISCAVTSQRPFAALAFEGRREPDVISTARIYTEKPQSTLIGGQYITTVNQQISFRIRGGEFPFARALQTTAGQLVVQCTITGETLN